MYCIIIDFGLISLAFLIGITYFILEPQTIETIETDGYIKVLTERDFNQLCLRYGVKADLSNKVNKRICGDNPFPLIFDTHTKTFRK